MAVADTQKHMRGKLLTVAANKKLTACGYMIECNHTEKAYSLKCGRFPVVINT